MSNITRNHTNDPVLSWSFNSRNGSEVAPEIKEECDYIEDKILTITDRAAKTHDEVMPFVMLKPNGEIFIGTESLDDEPAWLWGAIDRLAATKKFVAACNKVRDWASAHPDRADEVLFTKSEVA